MSMICRSCGAEIADKAIVCYRCGTPTTAPAAPPASARRRGSGRQSGWLTLAVLLAILAAGAWLIPKTSPGSAERIVAWVATWLIVFAAVAWLRRRRS